MPAVMRVPQEAFVEDYADDVRAATSIRRPSKTTLEATMAIGVAYGQHYGIVQTIVRRTDYRRPERFFRAGVMTEHPSSENAVRELLPDEYDSMTSAAKDAEVAALRMHYRRERGIMIGEEGQIDLRTAILFEHATRHPNAVLDLMA